ncbi:hypothetical protein EAH78_20270 [Pseudomonas arsenicoxydans]|uniref:DUF2384 domain-containing protein n=2 Tax=Pseudomonas arsenicoxydans TaxID=702115 RepID=A0A502HPZ4_9PSED|nr:hypothetical protein EAH78_20270 [Pseudomonas arsenicoxydans]
MLIDSFDRTDNFEVVGMTFSTDAVGFVRESPVIEVEATPQDAEGSRHKIVITVNAKSQEMVDAYLRSVDMLTQAFRAHLHPLPADTISTIVALMVPKQPVPSTILREARMLAKSKTEILQSNDWVTANEISHLAQFSSRNPRSQPNKWKQAGKIFALRHAGVDYFPIYGLDPAQGFRPFTALEGVISTLTTLKDGWAMAFWFASPNTFLGGNRPQDVFLADPSGVLSAAKEEVAGDIGG